MQDKNYDLSIKKDTIIKLSEEKDLFFTNHCQTPTNNMNNKNELYKMKVQLQYALKEKEKYIQQIKYLNTIIQLFSFDYLSPFFYFLLFYFYHHYFHFHLQDLQNLISLK